MKQKLHYLGYTLEFITCFFLVIAVLVTIAQVFCRFVFDLSLSWSQEVLMISFVWFVLFGTALSVKHKEHLKIDLIDKLSPLLKRILKVVEVLIVFAFIFVFVFYGIILVKDNLITGQAVGFISLKVAYVYMAIPISGLFMFYYTVKDLVKK